MLSLSNYNFQERNLINRQPLNLTQLPDDILYQILKNLDILTIQNLRMTCRNLLYIFPNEYIFSDMIIPARLSEDRFIQLLLRLQFLSCLDLVRKVMFLNSTITGKAAIMLLEQCEKIQKISFIGCQKIIIPSLTSKLVEWKVNETYESPKLFCFQNFVFSRCAGGSRHALTINKINSDLQILRSEPNSRPSIFQVTECNDPNCEQCTSECGNCGVKYNFCDSFWMNCRWCNKRQFCGPCVAFRGSPTNNAFAYMRLKICHLFNIPCPE